MKKQMWLWILLGAFLLVILCFGMFVCFAVRSASGPMGDGNIALVHVEGVISAGKSAAGVFGSSGAGSENLLKTLDRVASNPRILAIVLRVNSPGGTAAGSQEVYEKLMAIKKETGKKIVVSMGDVAASGAYYISSAADKIYANPATLTGSIGVIAELMNFHGLFSKIGVQPEILKAGRLKDLGNQNRSLTPEEKQIFQTLLDETHSEFIQDVAKGRKLPEDVVRGLADGRVYTGKQAQQLHLVDELGNLEDAEVAAAKLAGIEGKGKVTDVDRKSVLEQLLGDTPTSEYGATFHQPGIWFLSRLLPLH